MKAGSLAASFPLAGPASDRLLVDTQQVSLGSGWPRM